MDPSSTASRPVNRRRFMLGAGRTAAVLTLAAFAGWQETKRRRIAQDPACRKLSPCFECIEFERCQKPKARALADLRRLDGGR